MLQVEIARKSDRNLELENKSNENISIKLSALQFLSRKRIVMKKSIVKSRVKEHWTGSLDVIV